MDLIGHVSTHKRREGSMLKALGLILVFFSSICFANRDLKLLVEPKDISKKVQAVAVKIDKEYQGKELVIVMIMKGALFITADLMRDIQIPYTLEYLNTTSYNQTDGIKGKKKPKFGLSGLESINLASKHVLIIDDVFDSGDTMLAVVNFLKQKHPKSIKSLALVTMRGREKARYYPDYVLFNAEKLGMKFPLKGQGNRKSYIIGYGIDYEEKFRGLPGLYVYSTD